ncbi:MAG: vWA domain-containing protein [Fibrobacterota bacterium]
MKKNIKTPILFIFALLLFINITSADTIPQVWVTHTLGPSIIYHEGGPNPSVATCTLRAYASNDSATIGQALDVVILTDNSGSMSTRNPGTRDWIPPISRIQGTYNASVNFVDSTLHSNDRVAHMRFCALVDTPQGFTNLFPLAKARMDTNINGKETVHGVTYQGTASYVGVLKAVRYLAQNHRSNVMPVIVMLTDGEDNASGSYGGYWKAGMPNLGNTKQKAVDSVVKIIDSLSATGLDFKIYTVNLGSYIDSTHLKRIARQGHGLWAYSATGADLDAIFYQIGQTISGVAAISLTPGAPMLRDVLGPNIHYVTGSYVATTGPGYEVPTGFTVDNVGGLQRLNFALDTLRVNRIIEITYQITVALHVPDIYNTSNFIPVNLSKTDNPTYYSYVTYKDVKDSLVEKPLPKNLIRAKTSIAGLFLSVRADSTVPPDSFGTKVISLRYGFSTPAVYPDHMMYALLKQVSTDSFKFTSVNSGWNFQPISGWTAPIFNSAVDSGQNKLVGVTVPYNLGATCSLKIGFKIFNTLYSDYLLFSAADSSTPEQVVRIIIDNDTTSRATFIDTPWVVTGNRAQLAAYTQAFYARSISNRNSIRPLNAHWSISGFTLYNTQLEDIFTGTSPRRTLTNLTLPAGNSSQSDSGLLVIDSAGFSYSFRLIILDTTEYDTVDVTAIFDTNYGGNTGLIEANYPTQNNNLTYYPNLGDSLSFFSMMFDSNASGIKYLGNQSATWQLNGNTPVNATRFGIRSYASGALDVLVLSYTNEWGSVKRDTIQINWGYDTQRILSLESQPGLNGSTVAYPVTSVVVPNTADTVWGIYAVIRDEYGNCVDNGANSPSVRWLASTSAALDYINIPTDTTSIGFIDRDSTPALPLVFHLKAYGINYSGILGQVDSVLVTVANYTYTKLEIYAGQPIQGYYAGDLIPRDTVIRLSCDMEGNFQARALHDGTLYDTVSVIWSVDDASLFQSGDFPFYSTDVIVAPLAPIVFNRLIAAYVKAAGDTLRDTLRFLVANPVLTSLSLDTVNTPTPLHTLELWGNRDQLRALRIPLFANAVYNCPGTAASTVPALWHSASVPTAPWFRDQLDTTANLLSLDLSRMPTTNGSHSFNGTINIQYGSKSDNITFILHDTTDYDTLKYFVVDTSNYSGRPDAYPTFQDLINNTGERKEFTLEAGQSLTFYPLLFDAKLPGPTPKLIGNDLAKFEVHRTALGTVLDTQGLSYRITGTRAYVSDTIIVRYPGTTRLLSEAEYPLMFPGDTQTLIIHWQTATSETRMVITSANVQDTTYRISGDTLSMPMALNRDTVYAMIFDPYGNPVSQVIPDVTLWDVSDSTYLSLPAVITHQGTIVKKGVPAAATVYQLIATLPASTYLGGRTSPSYPLRDTIYVRVGSFDYTDIRLLTDNNPDSLATTLGPRIAGNNAVLTTADTLVFRACDDAASFKAQVYDNSTASWVNTTVSWTYNGAASSGTVAPMSASALDTLRAVFTLSSTASLTAAVRFHVQGDYVSRVWLEPGSDRFLVIIDTTHHDTTITLSALGRSTCGTDNSLVVSWTSYGFTKPLWRDSMAARLLAPQQSKLLQFADMPHSGYNQSDSGTIKIRYYNAVLGDTLKDSLKLIIRDITDYDTARAMIILPDSAYRNAADKDGLYDGYRSWSPDSAYAGDSLALTSLLFDFKAFGEKFLGAGSAPGSNAQTFWYYNGAESWGPTFTHTRNTPGIDTLEVIYKGNNGDTLFIKSFYINWTFGRARMMRIESAPGVVGGRTPNDVMDPITFGPSKMRDTVYAVVRDEFNNFISNEPLKWSMKPDGYITYFDIPTASVSQGALYNKSKPGATLEFDFIARLDRNVVIAGVATPDVQRDTVKVVVVQYDFIDLRILADVSRSPVRDTGSHTYAVSEDIPKTQVLFLTALQDTVTLKAQMQRDSDSGWMSQSINWRVTNAACVADSSFPRSQNVTLAPVSSLARDTLVAWINTGSRVLYDTIFFTVDLPWVDSVVLVYGTTSVIAGDTFPFSIIMFDKDGNIVTHPARLPDGFRITTNGQTLYIGNGYTSWIVNGSRDLNTDFDSNGVAVHRLVNYTAGLNQITIDITYPINGRDTTFSKTITLNVATAEPDSIVVLRDKDNTPAVLDTLSTFGDITLTGIYYRVEMYDRFGNLIPSDNLFYNAIRIAAQGGVLDTARFSHVGGNKIGYSAAGNEKGGLGTIVISYPAPGDTLRYGFGIVIIPLTRFVRLATYEWVADTANRVDIEAKLRTVLGLEPDTVVARDTSTASHNQKYLNALNAAGYKPYRDGYLDYLTLTFTDSFNLTENIILRVAFDTIVDGRPDSVVWMDSSRALQRLVPLDTLAGAPAGFHKRYALWLKPHALDIGKDSPFETGLLPVITFSNDSIRYRNLAEQRPVLLGDGSATYTLPVSLIHDSAAPVIAEFQLQNNACNPNNPNNTVLISFSEPVAFPAGLFSDFKLLKGLTLENNGHADSLFMADAISKGERIDRVFDPMPAWNYANEPTKMMTCWLMLNSNTQNTFRPNVSLLRFSVDPFNLEFTDMAGNKACGAANRPLVLTNDNSVAVHICDVSGNTVVSRYESAQFSWSPSTDGSTSKPKPDFPYFGFTVNLSWLMDSKERNTVLNDSVFIGGNRFVLCDFNPAVPFIVTEVTIFDLLGNLVATPATNKSLKASFTVDDIRKYKNSAADTGYQNLTVIDTNFSGMTLNDIKRYYTISEHRTGTHDPDTLRPIYPPTLTLGYDYLYEKSAANLAGMETRDIPVPAWNCLNSKGRLVAPGGYLVQQYIRTGGTNTEVSRKLIVTSGNKPQSF